MAAYESEYTRFMAEWMKRHQEEVDVQRRGRAMWWDHLSTEQRVPHLQTRAYSYDDNFQEPPKTFTPNDADSP